VSGGRCDVIAEACLGDGTSALILPLLPDDREALRGGRGCSTSEKPPAWVSSVSIMKRTPIEPRLPALPSLGPTILGVVWVCMGALLSMNAVFND
jgi:hypothetical protein